MTENKSIPDDLAPYSKIESYDKLISNLNELNTNTLLTQKQIKFIIHQCDQYYKNHSNDFSLDETIALNKYKILKDRHPQMVEKYCKNLLKTTINENKTTDTKTFSFILNNIPNENLDFINHILKYFVLIENNNQKDNLEQFEIVARKNFELFFTFYKKSNNNEYLKPLLLKYITPNKILENSYLFEENDPIILETVNKIIKTDNDAVKKLLHILRQPSDLVQERIASVFHEIENKDKNVAQLILENINTQIIEKHIGFDVILDLFLTKKDTIIDLKHTIGLTDSESGEAYTSENHLSREITVNEYQNIFFNHFIIANKMPNFYEKYQQQLLAPITEKINNIEKKIDIFEFFFHNSQYNQAALSFNNCLEYMTDQQHQFFSNILFRKYLTSYVDADKCFYTFTKIPPDKSDIYQQTLYFFQDHSNQNPEYDSESKKIKIKNILPILLQKKLEIAVPLQNENLPVLKHKV